MPSKPRDTEVDAYIFIKESLKTLGWDTRNPSRVSSGQVWTQTECLHEPEIRKLLGAKHPENIVKVSHKVLWVIEAKRSHSELADALKDAEGRVRALNQGGQFQVRFISGVAGNSLDSFLIRNRFVTDAGEFLPITLNKAETTALLNPAQASMVLASSKPDISNPQIDEKLFISRAERINEILHLGAVNPHKRAGVMAALLLSMLSSTPPNIEERNPTALIGDINARLKGVLERQEKPEFYEYIRIEPPTAQDNHVKFRMALVNSLQELNNLNIRSAMNTGVDWLGAFYEVFLKYANWAQDLGIVLTPRHVPRWVADVMNVQVNDIIYDPTCGTGGFLVAAFDSMKARANPQQLDRFKQNALFGVEQDSGIASLAVVNMIFRGDGKNNIREGNCFAQFLEPWSNNGVPTARYVPEQSKKPPVTKVMMNPPFALKSSSDKEFKFLDQALAQMEDGGTLFSVLPYAAMVKPGVYLTWRRESLLKSHTLLAVVTLPPDVFYPVGVTTVGIFVRKGTPHPKEQPVLWIRAINDGLWKSKGKRLPNDRMPDDLGRVRTLTKAFLGDPQYPAPNIQQFQKAAPIDFSDKMFELVPEVYLDQAAPTETEVVHDVGESIRCTFAYLVKINKAVIRPSLMERSAVIYLPPHHWQSFRAEALFTLNRGHFHSIANLDPGPNITISRVSTDNGMVGFYEKPDDAVILAAKTLTVSTVTGDAFVQPQPFIATDNVVLCTPKAPHAPMCLTSLYFIAAMLNRVRWRYSYGRQCYKSKFAQTDVVLPVKGDNSLDENYMGAIVENAQFWPLVETAHA